MSSFSEQDCVDPDDPQLDYTPLRLSERAAKLGRLVSQEARSEPIRSSRLPVLHVPKLTRHTRDLDRRTALLSVATGVAGVAAVAALLVVTMKPASRQSAGNPTPSEITGSVAEPKPPVTSPPSQPAADGQSNQLLQDFLQWREKAKASEASQSQTDPVNQGEGIGGDRAEQAQGCQLRQSPCSSGLRN
jgi:hypothetical protein